MSLKQKIQDNYQIIIIFLLFFFIAELTTFYSNQTKKLGELFDLQECHLTEITNQLKDANKKLESMEQYLWSIEWDVTTKF